MVCTFFGNEYTPGSIQPKLFKTMEYLINEKNVNKFYVGNQGNFDYMVFKCLKELKEKYSGIDYAVVIAYFPKKKEVFNYVSEEETVYPEGLEKVPPRFAICKRNDWMIAQSDYVITYVKTVGRAADFKEKAQKKGKTIIELY